jgi:hypothetical protein
VSLKKELIYERGNTLKTSLRNDRGKRARTLSLRTLYRSAYLPQVWGPMAVVERLTAAEIQLRSPPVLVKDVA